jgi:hypothetical protein
MDGLECDTLSLLSVDYFLVYYLIVLYCTLNSLFACSGKE